MGGIWGWEGVGNICVDALRVINALAGSFPNDNLHILVIFSEPLIEVSLWRRDQHGVTQFVHSIHLPRNEDESRVSPQQYIWLLTMEPHQIFSPCTSPRIALAKWGQSSNI